MPMKVSSTETGIDTAVTIVERSEIRKMKITITAKSRPSSPSCASDSIDCSMNGAWLKTIVNSAPSPSASASPGSASRTAFDDLDGVARRGLRDRDGERGLAVDARVAGDRLVGDLDARRPRRSW